MDVLLGHPLSPHMVERSVADVNTIHLKNVSEVSCAVSAPQEFDVETSGVEATEIAESLVMNCHTMPPITIVLVC